MNVFSTTEKLLMGLAIALLALVCFIVLEKDDEERYSPDKDKEYMESKERHHNSDKDVE